MASNIKEAGGYDVEFVGNEPNDVTCSICLFVLREPMQAENCGHRFCKSFIEDLKNSGNGTIVCPEDRNVIKVFKDNGKEREILNALVKCSNNKDGCTFTMELRDRENHLEVCVFQTIPCPIQGCQDKFQRRFVDSHKKDEHEIDRRTLDNKLEQILQELEIKNQKMESLIEKTDSQDKKIASFNQRIKSQNQKMESQNQKIESLNHKIQSQSQKIESQSQQCESQAIEINSLKQSLSEVKSSNQVFSDTYIWEIRYFAKKFARARQNINNNPQVRRFFTSKGYKVISKVYLNGIHDYWDKKIVVYFGLERGPFDNTLKWPMSATITVGDSGEEFTRQFNTKTYSYGHIFDKPSDILDDSSNGVTGFHVIPTQELNGIVQNDTLIIKVFTLVKCTNNKDSCTFAKELRNLENFEQNKKIESQNQKRESQNQKIHAQNQEIQSQNRKIKSQNQQIQSQNR